MEIRRFGIGFRRPDGPPGTRGVTGGVIESGSRGTISELAFGRGTSLEPHTNPNATWFIVIEGGGFVQVGDERARVAAGEAVLWPPGVVHAAWAELSEMRAIVVELAAAGPGEIAGLLEGRARDVPVDTDDTDATARAEGALRTGLSPAYDPSEGEPV
jgi:quercetin dioxygenase-like cupin family protein